jgi:hypothetical protein
MILVFKEARFYIQMQNLDFIEKVTLRRTIKSPLVRDEPKRMRIFITSPSQRSILG